MNDIGLFIVDNCIDIKIDGGDLASDDGLETAVLISLFSDRRASDEEVPFNEDKRGYWGDLFNDDSADQLGSKLWLTDRSKVSLASLVKIETYAKDSLQWMIDDGVAVSISANAEFDQNSSSSILLAIEIEKPDDQKNRFKFFWDNQIIKRS